MTGSYDEIVVLFWLMLLLSALCGAFRGTYLPRNPCFGCMNEDVMEYCQKNCCMYRKWAEQCKGES